VAREFLYIIAVIIVMVIATGFILRLYQDELTQFAFVPNTEFIEVKQLETSIYDNNDMWFSRGDVVKFTNNPTLWKPDSIRNQTAKADAAIFFIHPTSYLEKEYWNAPLDHTQSQSRARLFTRGMASVFNSAGDIWVPRYRQAAFGAFLTTAPEGVLAQKSAYNDVLLAFDRFIADIDENRPIILAGHSQGSIHLIGILKDRIAGKPLANRIAAAYVVGWPVAVKNDLPYLGLPICKKTKQSGCIMSWQSFAEPADYKQLKSIYSKTIGFDGTERSNSAIICTNPVAGGANLISEAQDNLGTLVPNNDLTAGELVPKSVPARCNKDGFLLIGDPPELGPYVLPGNNYHVYDYPLFWMNIRRDALNRLKTFKTSNIS